MTVSQGEESAMVCSRCAERLNVQSGGWAYVYTQVLLHLDRCASDLSEHERQALATSLVSNGRD